ncbi:MAG: ABC transporter ATP-binding protein [Armatimonadota bacterium]|nr:ABC transporter ATP-binding protein [Armatimonadota bacterium]MDR7486763.1 ABC transporter ATP-binding protein [Armatimonadota bacterium]MDR7533220.1 ABC transporter ATP-binding protein [Armatimonadota bacterium]MDR7535392.1 ABC transporter ATP-binding protein [Armatimonadota bacterium]
MSEPAVAARGLTRRFGAFVAVDHIDLEIRRGEVFGFLGPNGAGKSTTIRMLCGILDRSEGEVRVLGLDPAREPERLRPRIGYMSQRASLYGDLTVVEQLEFYARVYGLDPATRRRKVHDWIAMAGLRGRERDLVSTLSGGWRQRLAMGCAILHRPDLLLLDEPTAGVDPLSRRQFWDLIYRFAEDGTTVMVTTHYMDEAEHCDRVAFIYGGRIVAEGAPGEMKRRHLPGALLRVEAEPWMPALEVVRASPLVAEAALYGTAIHARVAEPARAAPALADALAAAGVRVRAIVPQAPTLEDVFVALVAGGQDAPPVAGAAEAGP